MVATAMRPAVLVHSRTCKRSVVWGFASLAMICIVIIIIVVVVIVIVVVVIITIIIIGQIILL